MNDLELLENFSVPPEGVKAISSSSVIGNIPELHLPRINQTYLLDFVQYEGKTSTLDFIKFNDPAIRDLPIKFNKWSYKKNISQKYFEYRIEGHCYYFGFWCDYNIFIVFHPICPQECQCPNSESDLHSDDDYCHNGCACKTSSSNGWVPDEIALLVQKEICKKISAFQGVLAYHFTNSNFKNGDNFEIPISFFRNFNLQMENYPHNFFKRHHFKFVVNKIGQNIPEQPRVRRSLHASELCRFDISKVKSYKFAIAGDTKVEVGNSLTGIVTVFNDEMLPTLFNYQGIYINEHPRINYFPKSFQQNFGSIQSDSVFPKRMEVIQSQINDESPFFNLELLSNQLYNQTSRLLRRNEALEIWRNLPISNIFNERLSSKRIQIFNRISSMNDNLRENLNLIYNAGVGPRYEVVFNLSLKPGLEQGDILDAVNCFSEELDKILTAFKQLCRNEIRNGLAYVRRKVFPTIMMAYNDILWRSIKQQIQKFIEEPDFKLSPEQKELILIIERLLLVNINGNYKRFLTGPCTFFQIKNNLKRYHWPYFPNQYFMPESYSISLGMHFLYIFLTSDGYILSARAENRNPTLLYVAAIADGRSKSIRQILNHFPDIYLKVKGFLHSIENMENFPPHIRDEAVKIFDLIIVEQFIPQFGLFVLEQLKYKYKKQSEFYTDFIQTLSENSPSEIFKLIRQSGRFIVRQSQSNYNDLLQSFFPTMLINYDYPRWMTCFDLLADYLPIFQKITAIHANIYASFQTIIREQGIFITPKQNGPWKNGSFEFDSYRANEIATGAPLILQLAAGQLQQAINMGAADSIYTQPMYSVSIGSRAIQRKSTLSLFYISNEQCWLKEFNTWMKKSAKGGISAIG